MKQNKTSSTQAAGTQASGSQNAFKKTVRILSERLCELICESEIPDKRTSDREHRRLALLEIIDASNMQFNEFYDRLQEIAPETSLQFADQLDTLDTLAEVCLMEKDAK